jgi:rSAM/selenodomain-associated transferase 2
LFEGIPWSTGHVLARSIEKARSLGLTHRLLGELPDVDEPADLPDAEAALAQGRRVSVVVPALNEAENLRRLLPQLAAGQPHEILVADGGSRDDTAQVAASLGATVIAAPRGRARQMNAAAARATGEHLLFLHADTDPPQDFAKLVADTLDRVGTAAGAFRFALREPIPGGFLVERGVALRCALRQLPYGDQGLFLRRHLFQALGGFPDWPLLEDLELVRRLRRLGRIAVTDEAAPTSSRRWREAGLIRTFLRHQSILLAHALGASPERLMALRQAKNVKSQSGR